MRGQVGGAGGIVPDPVAEPFGQLGGFLLRGEGGIEIEDGAFAVGGADRVADIDLALFEDGLGEVRCGVALGAPGGGGQHGVGVAAHGPDLAAGVLDPQPGVVEDLAQELLHVPGADPGRAEPGVDLPGRQVRRDDLAQRRGVDLEPRVVERGLGGGGELGADVAGQVLRRRDQPPAAGLVEDQGGKLLAGVGFGGAEQAGDLGEVGLAAGVQADGQRVGRGIRAQPRRPGRDDPPVEHRRLGRALADRVELLERQDQRGIRIVAEPALRRPDPGHDRLAGLDVGSPGAAHREPVQRPVRPQVGVVTAVQVRAQPGDLRRVIGRGGLGIQELAHGVAQAQQLAQFRGLASGDLVRPLAAAQDPGERPVGAGADEPVALRGTRRQRRRPGPRFGRQRRGSPDQAARPGRRRDRVQSRRQGRDRVARGADHEVIGPVHAAGRT